MARRLRFLARRCKRGIPPLAFPPPGRPCINAGQFREISLSEAESQQANHPPRPPLVLSVGITGHRVDRLTAERARTARLLVEDALSLVTEAATAIAAEGTAFFAPGPPEMRLISALAEGADRLCAEAGLDSGYRLDVALPFPREEYAADFRDEDSRARFTAQLDRADRILELPGDRGDSTSAYSLAGGAIIAASDILIAIWNGQGSGGRGGTGDVVANALNLGKPVIHVPLEASRPVRLLWPGEGPAGGAWHSALEPPSEPFDRATLEQAMRTILLPPADAGEREALATFFGEEEKLRMRRIEYPLLLAVTGAQKLSRRAWRKPAYLPTTRAEWQRFDAAVQGHVDPPRLERLEQGYSWADHLATRFAQSFRSGHVVNFAFSALAVALALFGFLFGGDVKIAFVIIELLLIAAIVANTRIGHAEYWQHRWLDYRQLAERLRPMRSLKLLAVARPPAVSAANRTATRRWIDWYAAAMWRQIGLPEGRIDQPVVDRLVQLVRDEEAAPEIAYQRTNAHRMAHVNHRLHQFGSICFGLTVLLCIGFLLSTAVLDHATAARSALLFTVATATLPAFGTAAYGLRVQGDFNGSAARSIATADALESMVGELQGHPNLARTAAVANAIAAILLVDIAEWRLTYQQRQLEIPG